MKVIIHIGSHKTGTSFLQQFLFENRCLLKSQNILYPESILSGNNHGVFANLFKQPDKEQCKHNLEKLQKEVNEFKPNILLISSECFLEGKAIASHFKALFQIPYNEIKIVCYLRPQFDWFTSLYNELVRDPFRRFTGPIDESREFHSQFFDYLALVSPWKEEYPHDSLQLLAYDQKHFIEGKLESDFCIKALGLTSDFLLQSTAIKKGINCTLKPPYVHFLIRVNQVPLSISDYNLLVSELNQQSNLDNKKYANLLSPRFFDKLEKLTNNKELREYGISDLPISSRLKATSYFTYTLDHELRIMKKLSQKTNQNLIKNAHNYGLDLVNNNSFPSIPINEKIRINNVLKRQEFELQKIYNIGLPVNNVGSIDALIIKQRIHLREYLAKI